MKAKYELMLRGMYWLMWTVEDRTPTVQKADFYRHGEQRGYSRGEVNDAFSEGVATGLINDLGPEEVRYTDMAAKMFLDDQA